MRVKIREIPGILFIILSCAFYILKESNLYSAGMKYILPVAVLLGCSYLLPTLLHKNKNKKWVLLLLLCILITMIRSTDTRMIVAFSAVVVGMNLSDKSIWKSSLLSRVIFFALAMMSGGIGHINGVAMQIGAIMFAYLLYRNDKFNRKDFIIFTTVYILGALYTKSGSFIVSGGFAIVLLFFYKRKTVKKVLASNFIRFIYPITLVANVIMCFAVADQYFSSVRRCFSVISFGVLPKVFDAMDILTSSRLSLGGESLHRYGISLFGGNIQYESLNDGFSYFNVDSGMLWLLQGWGLIMTVVVLGLFSFTMKTLQNEKKHHAVIVGLILALWSANEDMLVSISANIMFYVVGRALASTVRRQKMKEIDKYANT